MGTGITWYDVLGVLPGASTEEIRRSYDAKARLLGPQYVAGAPSTVLTAASRAGDILAAAWRVLGDPTRRAPYDERAGIQRSGGGLARRGNTPSDPGWESPDFDPIGGEAEAGLLGGLILFAGLMGPHHRQPSRVTVPDVRGLFFSVCSDIVGRQGIHVTPVRLTEHPMPVDGLVVGQSPGPGTKMRSTGVLTVQVWHPPSRR